MWRIILSGDLRMDYMRAEAANGAGLNYGDWYCGEKWPALEYILKAEPTCCAVRVDVRWKKESRTIPRFCV